MTWGLSSRRTIAIEILLVDRTRRPSSGRAPADRRSARRLLRPTGRGGCPRPTPRSRARRCSARCARWSPYDTLDEAIGLANGTRYGLQAGIFTRDLQTAFRAARELEFGGVTVNEAPTFRADQMPYGGVKDSGNTREGPAYAVREMTEERLVVFQL